MKRMFLGLLAGVALMLTSCETTREIDLHADGAGTVSTTTDLSALIGMIKMSGKEEDMKGMERAIDTTIDLAVMADSIPDLSPEEKALVRTGKLGVVINMEDEKFLFKLDFPFKNISSIGQIDKISTKVITQASKKQMGGDADAAAMPEDGKSSPEDYFVTTYSPGKIEKKLDKEKYAGVADNEVLNGMKEMAGMGMGKSTVVINLPKPAKKAEGQGVTLSEDKKKVTIVSSLEDFYDDATKMEYHIEY